MRESVIEGANIKGLLGRVEAAIKAKAPVVDRDANRVDKGFDPRAIAIAEARGMSLSDDPNTRRKGEDELRRLGA